MGDGFYRSKDPTNSYCNQSTEGNTTKDKENNEND